MSLDDLLPDSVDDSIDAVGSHTEVAVDLDILDCIANDQPMEATDESFDIDAITSLGRSHQPPATQIFKQRSSELLAEDLSRKTFRSGPADCLDEVLHDGLASAIALV